LVLPGATVAVSGQDWYASNGASEYAVYWALKGSGTGSQFTFAGNTSGTWKTLVYRGTFDASTPIVVHGPGPITFDPGGNTLTFRTKDMQQDTPTVRYPTLGLRLFVVDTWDVYYGIPAPQAGAIPPDGTTTRFNALEGNWVSQGCRTIILEENAEVSGIYPQRSIAFAPYGGESACIYTLLLQGGAVTGPVSAVRGLLGQLYVAQAKAGALTVSRYSDAWPETVEGTSTVESSGVSACALGYRRSGILDIVYELNGAILRRESRDCGRTWSVASTIASGYKYPAPCLYEQGGIWPIMLYKDSAWYLTVGTLGADNAWAFTAPALKITGAADSPGQLSRRSDGLWQFVYTDTGGNVKAVYSRGMAAAGSGTFA
jgi:hypothetical protein